MDILAGTSGFSYKEWKGVFYPEKLPASEMLRFYAGRLHTVEINNTFYRVPRASVLETWAEQVPAGFRFAVKASRRITHIKRLKDAAEETRYFLERIAVLGDRLGAILFQLPPYLRKDTARLSQFLDLLPEGTPAAFEFRHASWGEDDVLEALRARGAALCIADDEERDAAATGVPSTTDWGYLRLRRADYQRGSLEAWAERIARQPWSHALCYFKHEDEGAGPRLAAEFQALGREPGPSSG